MCSRTRSSIGAFTSAAYKSNIKAADCIHNDCCIILHGVYWSCRQPRWMQYGETENFCVMRQEFLNAQQICSADTWRWTAVAAGKEHQDLTLRTWLFSQTFKNFIQFKKNCGSKYERHCYPPSINAVCWVSARFCKGRSEHNSTNLRNMLGSEKKLQMHVKIEGSHI